MFSNFSLHIKLRHIKCTYRKSNFCHINLTKKTSKIIISDIYSCARTNLWGKNLCLKDEV